MVTKFVQLTPICFKRKHKVRSPLSVDLSVSVIYVFQSQLHLEKVGHIKIHAF